MTFHFSRAINICRRDGFGGEDIAIISGSGQGWLADLLTETRKRPYHKIPGMPKSSVQGHGNTLFHGTVGKSTVLLFSGRFHLYEGFCSEEVTCPVRLAAGLGVKRIMLLNAAGAVNPQYNETDLMVITDHINLMGRNPLEGYRGIRQKFVDMTHPYDAQLIAALKASAKAEKILVHEGIYAAMIGPSYETPAEIRMLRTLGADAVGMSTVPEVIVARQEGLEVLGLSIITNTQKKKGILSHDEVLKNAARTSDKMRRLLVRFLSDREGMA